MVRDESPLSARFSHLASAFSTSRVSSGGQYPDCAPGYHQVMAWPDRIAVDPDVLEGKPVIRGTRLAVELILDLLAAGQAQDAIFSNYPGLTREDILACLAFAGHLAHQYRAYPLPV